MTLAAARIAVIMGSQSDWATMRHSADTLDELGLDYEAAIFKIETHAYASEREALAWAAKNPQDASHMVLVLAGNDALRTVKLAATARFEQTPYAITGEVGARPAVGPGRRRAQ